MTTVPLIATVDTQDVSSIHAASVYGQGFFTPSNLIKLLGNRGAGRFMYDADNRKPVTPWSSDHERWHGL